MSILNEEEFARSREISAIGDLIWQEAMRQVDKWGEQNHPSFLVLNDGNPLTDPVDRALCYCIPTEAQAKRVCENSFESGMGSYADIFIEEVCEAMGAVDGQPLEDELIQVAAVAINWIRAIRRRQTNDTAVTTGETAPDAIS